MLINDKSSYAVESLAALFGGIADRFSGRLVAVGRPEPGVPRVQKAHVRIAYTGPTGANPSGLLSDGQPCCIVHTVCLEDDGSISLGGGTYDVTPMHAWTLVR